MYALSQWRAQQGLPVSATQPAAAAKKPSAAMAAAAPWTAAAPAHQAPPRATPQGSAAPAYLAVNPALEVYSDPDDAISIDGDDYLNPGDALSFDNGRPATQPGFAPVLPDEFPAKGHRR